MRVVMELVGFEGKDHFMLTVRVKYDGKVFVPLEPVTATHIKEALVIIVDEERSQTIRYGSKEYEEWQPLPDEERMQQAYEEFKAKFPDTDVAPEDFRYVGIMPPLSIEDSKRELRDIIAEKYSDV